MTGKVEEVRGKRVVVRFDASKCIHSRMCVLSRPDVFVPNAPGEWIHPDRATPEEIERLALACPSGAIGFERLDGAPAEAPPLVNTLTVRENGPLALHAPTSIAGSDAGLRLTLCRCGASKNKPYCDGSHAAAAFAATGEPATRESAPLEGRGGPVAIQPVKDGPLHVQGPLEVVSGTGRTVDRVKECWLCRCGASARKPYCDGSHKRLGFSADGIVR